LRPVRLFLRLGPFALLAAVAAGLAASWYRLPARYPTHFGIGGADRWADLSIRSVAWPLLDGLVAVAWIGLLRRFILANSSPAPEPSRARRLVECITIGAQWFLALLFGLAAVPQENGPGLALVGVGVGFLLLPVALIVTYSGKEPPAGPSVPPPPEGWLFVPRKNGAGLGIAPGHPRTWQAVALLAGGLLALIAFGLVS
jgi:uncharacterized membrane protein